MRSSSSGFLLLLLGSVALIGFLTGNLDRWLAYLFSAGAQPVVTAAPTAASVAAGAADRRGSVA